MKFKVKFARIVSEAQLVEAVIEAPDQEGAIDLFNQGDFQRFLITKRDLREVTGVGKPEFVEIK